jgi:cell division protein FtsL
MGSGKSKKRFAKYLLFFFLFVLLAVAALSALEFGLSFNEEHVKTGEQVKKLESDLNEKKRELDKLKNEYQKGLKKDAEKRNKGARLKLEEKDKKIETFKIKTQQTNKQNRDLKTKIKDLEQKINAMEKAKERNYKKMAKKFKELKEKYKEKIRECKNSPKTVVQNVVQNYDNKHFPILLTKPENGRENAKAGEAIYVEGIVKDKSVKEAHLLLNNQSIPLKVSQGHFRKKITLPDANVATFRVFATGENGAICYSSLNTVSLGGKIALQANPTLF